MTDDQNAGKGTAELAIGAGGGKLKVDRSFLEFIFPGRAERLDRDGRNHLREVNHVKNVNLLEDALTRRLAAKIESGESLDAQELGVMLLRDGERTKISNLTAVLERASKQLPPPGSPANQAGPRPDPDWLLRWREGAESFSNEAMQEVLARIATGEYVQPGSFSMRTLAIVRDMDQAVAEVFARVAPCVFAGRRIPTTDWPGYEQFGITFDDLLLLDDCGILDVKSSSTIEIGMKGCTVWKWGVRVPAEVDSDLLIHSFTKSGKELLAISDPQRTTDHVIAVVTWLKELFPSLEIAATPAKYVPWNVGDPLPDAPPE